MTRLGVSATLGTVVIFSMTLIGQKQSADGKVVSVEKFGTDQNLPLMVLLHGIDGLSAFYREQASFFAHHGYRVVLPHYMEAGKGQATSDSNYKAWTSAVRSVMDKFQQGRKPPTVLVGYSLGASVALALGSEGDGPDAIAEFYGSLPDNYYRDVKGMPPLLILHGGRDTNVPVYNATQLSQLCEAAVLVCESHIYPSEGHGFTGQALRDADQRVLDFFSANLR